MQGVVLSLFGAALAAGVAELLLPREQGGVAKLFRFLLSVVILLLILVPFGGFLQESEEILSGEIAFEESKTEDFSQIFSDTLNAQARAEFEEGLYSLLTREHGIQRKDATLLIRYDTQGELAHVSILLSGKALLQDPDALAKSLSKTLGCTVEVR